MADHSSSDDAEDDGGGAEEEETTLDGHDSRTGNSDEELINL